MRRFIPVLDSIGTALALHLMCVLFALPLVTAVPSTLALQEQVGVMRAGEHVGMRGFAATFARACRRTWPFGLAGPVVGAGLLFAYRFWWAAPTAVRYPAVGALAFVTGFLCAWYLCLLDVYGAGARGNARALGAAALARLTEVPLRALWAFILLAAWLVTVAYLPTLLLVGFGLVPVGIVSYTFRERRAGQASVS